MQKWLLLISYLNFLFSLFSFGIKILILHVMIACGLSKLVFLLVKNKQKKAVAILPSTLKAFYTTMNYVIISSCQQCPLEMVNCVMLVPMVSYSAI